MSTILFYSKVHNSFDDRTFYHHAIALKESGHKVFIFSEIEDLHSTEIGIKIISQNISHLKPAKKYREIKKLLLFTNPDIIICDYPTSIILLKICLLGKKKRLIYDITEWVPSKKNIYNVRFPLNIVKSVVLFLLNLLAGILSNRLMFGEYHKSLIFKLHWFQIKKTVSYFPDSKYINYKKTIPLEDSIKLFYSGWFSIEKGFDKVLLLSSKLAELLPDKRIELDIVGDFKTETTKTYFQSMISQLPNNVLVTSTGFLKFGDFCQHITNVDIFLDLRKNDFENTRCLPIKLFYYMACGRPVIYSDLKAIRHLLDINDFGYYFDGKNIDKIATLIANYFEDKELFEKHCYNAHSKFHMQYNWDLIKTDFVNFIVG